MSSLYQILLLYWCNLKELIFSSTVLLIADSCLLSYTRFVFVLALGFPASCLLPTCTVTLWCVCALEAQASISSAWVLVQVEAHPASSTDHSSAVFSALGFLCLVKTHASDTGTLSWKTSRLMNVHNKMIFMVSSYPDHSMILWSGHYTSRNIPAVEMENFLQLSGWFQKHWH